MEGLTAQEPPTTLVDLWPPRPGAGWDLSARGAMHVASQALQEPPCPKIRRSRCMAPPPEGGVLREPRRWPNWDHPAGNSSGAEVAADRGLPRKSTRTAPTAVPAMPTRVRIPVITMAIAAMPRATTPISASTEPLRTCSHPCSTPTEPAPAAAEASSTDTRRPEDPRSVIEDSMPTMIPPRASGRAPTARPTPRGSPGASGATASMRGPAGVAAAPGPVGRAAATWVSSWATVGLAAGALSSIGGRWGRAPARRRRRDR